MAPAWRAFSVGWAPLHGVLRAHGAPRHEPFFLHAPPLLICLLVLTSSLSGPSVARGPCFSSAHSGSSATDLGEGPYRCSGKLGSSGSEDLINVSV